MAKLNQDAALRKINPPPVERYALRLREGAPAQIQNWFENREGYRNKELSLAKQDLKTLQTSVPRSNGDELKKWREELLSAKNRVSELSGGSDVPCFPPQVYLNSPGSFGKCPNNQFRVIQVIDGKNLIASFTAVDFIKVGDRQRRVNVDRDVWISGIDTAGLTDEKMTMLDSKRVCSVGAIQYESVGGAVRTIIKVDVIDPDLWLIRDYTASAPPLSEHSDKR